MASVTHQKYDERMAIYGLLKEFLDVLDSDERRGIALALSERLMGQFNLSDLRSWRQGLESNKAKGWK